MKIVIDIPEEIIADAKTSPNFFPTYHFGTLWEAVRNGTPLPKGHGRLIDTDNLKFAFTDGTEDYEYAHWTMAGIIDEIDNAPTIIEADTESEG